MVCRRDVVLAAEGVDSLEVQRRVQGTHGTLIQRIGQVCRNLRHTLDSAQSRLEEVAGSGIFLTALCGLLCSHEVGIGEGLGLNLLSVEQLEQLCQEHIERTTVHHEVMDIHD